MHVFIVLNEKKVELAIVSSLWQLYCRLNLWMCLCIKEQKDFKACLAVKSESAFTSLFCTLLKFKSQSETPQILQLPISQGNGKDQAHSSGCFSGLPGLSSLFSGIVKAAVRFVYSFLVNLKSLQESQKVFLNIPQRILFSPHVQEEMGFPNVFMCWLRGEYFWSYN